MIKKIFISICLLITFGLGISLGILMGNKKADGKNDNVRNIMVTGNKDNKTSSETFGNAGGNQAKQVSDAKSNDVPENKTTIWKAEKVTKSGENTRFRDLSMGFKNGDVEVKVPIHQNVADEIIVNLGYAEIYIDGKLNVEISKVIEERLKEIEAEDSKITKENIEAGEAEGDYYSSEEMTAEENIMGFNAHEREDDAARLNYEDAIKFCTTRVNIEDLNKDGVNEIYFALYGGTGSVKTLMFEKEGGSYKLTAEDHSIDDEPIEPKVTFLSSWSNKPNLVTKHQFKYLKNNRSN